MSATELAAGTTVTMQARGESTTVTVVEPCDQDLGNWLCTSHTYLAMNNLQLELHASEPGEHLVAWLCHAHGLEQGSQEA